MTWYDKLSVNTTHTQCSRADWLKNRSLYDKSMKLGTQLEHVIKIILRYRAIADLTSDLYGRFFFQISDKIINFQSLILLICHFLIAHNKNISKGLFLSQKIWPLTSAAVFSSKFPIRSLISISYTVHNYVILLNKNIFKGNFVDKKLTFDLCDKIFFQILLICRFLTVHSKTISKGLLYKSWPWPLQQNFLQNGRLYQLSVLLLANCIPHKCHKYYFSHQRFLSKNVNKL